ncbi:MAG: DUF1566 domain-containing protein [Deltaproteobacteria bacterium]|nr:DUF1566 domain-containing protein [Deltaproteobacteria bacterium]
MKPLILWLITISALTFAVATCDDSDDDDPSTGSGSDDDDDGDDDTVDDDTDDDADDDIDDDMADDDTQAECDTWTDTTSGLTWLVDPAVTTPYAGLTWQEAMDYCDTLACGDHDDWRLPSISELRSLIRGCPATEPNGVCGVTDDCLSFDCTEDGENSPCDGCLTNDGPNDGCYSPLDIADTCEGDSILWTFWSSSREEFTSDENAWHARFSKGSVGNAGIYEPSGNARCARGEF